MISCEKIYFKSHECLVHNKLYEIMELESFREQMFNYFMKRYNIDYISMNIINKERNLLFFRMDNDNWHEALIEQKWTLKESTFFMSKIDTIRPEEIYFEYFEYEDRMTSARADIFGVRKYGGCDVIVSNKNNDIILYYITFKDDRAFGDLLRNVLNELVKDLVKYREIFTPFLRHQEQGGDFADKKSLHQRLDKFKIDNRSLFDLR